VDSAALRHGISFTKMRAWTKDEDNILREQANKMLLRRLAKKLKRTEDVVKRRAKELGLSLRKSGYYHHHATHPLRVRKKYAKLRASGMAQATAAREVGVHQATARRWENTKSGTN
jgi:transposase